ncbi:MAG: hypothetical protein Q9166_003868 [cf. Caloplaca sp. 2 TL-2023]
MSTTAPGGSGAPDEERKGLSKFVRRASKVFRRRSSARGSISGPSDFTQTTSGVPAAESSTAQVVSPPPIAEAAIEEQPTTATPTATTTQEPVEQKIAKPPNARFATTAADSGAIREERARALFAKYGLTLESGEWTSPIKPDAERVEKKIRMRIHRACHHCQTTFAADKICSNCKHTRCKKCPRYPTKRAKETKSKGVGAGGAPASTGDTALNLKSLTISSRVTGKQISYKPATQRVRRTCHKCNTLFEGRAPECSKCGHTRCQQCPREPPKKDKYPEGYPGDSDYNVLIRERHPIRVHVRWTCHQCSNTFRDLSRKCEGCGHERCDDCPRKPPKREKPKLDPDAIKKIDERMKEMEISPPAPASAS